MRSPKLGVRQMLYLDGTLSKMYRKGGSVPWQYQSVRDHDNGGEKNSGRIWGRPFQPGE
ncbi:lipoprotein [Klebsiella pneumoniae]|uniref:Lipoprotein n=1 Tax=Klebsiella pneumoniae TaxID=573 RepID=A0A2X3GZT5_KLEPN|nr:lipoprotein [Klebsiella pneumoniae]